MFEHIPFIGDWHRSIKLGGGDFANVWLWQHAKSNEKIVLKTCNDLRHDMDQYKERWQRENELITHKIRHLNIVRGLHVKPDTFLNELVKLNRLGMPIIITEYCEGGNLRWRLNDSRHASGMTESDVRNVLQSLCSAVFYLHSLSIIHCHIKPENVVIQLNKNGHRIYKLTDLGYTKPDFRNTGTKLANNFVYSAPEMITSEKYSCSADYWSLGIVLYEVICGLRPFVPHMPLAQWVLRVREKKSEHITIYEDNAGNMIYSNRIYAENQISNDLSKLLKIWFQLALEWHPKQRGFVFERPNQTTLAVNGVNANTDLPPVQVLKFFECAERTLAKKILTIFLMTNHKYISMEVTDESENGELFALIEREANIPATQCHIIIPMEINAMKKWNKPIDLYVHNYFDNPMVFVTHIENIGSSTSTISIETKADGDAVALELPETVQVVLKDTEKRLKIHCLQKFARDTLHIVHCENKKFKWCLDGLYNLAKHLNDEIDACQPNVKQMQLLIFGVVGFLEMFKQTADEKLLMVEEKRADFLQQYTKIAQNVNRLTNACDKITIRYSSLCRRIHELNHNELLSKRTQDFYDIINVTKAYDLLQKQISSNTIPAKGHFELYQCAYKCIKQRDSHLRNKTFIELKRNLNCIYIEFMEIKKALGKAVIPAEKYRNELLEVNKKLNECAMLSSTEINKKVECKCISTSTSDLTTANEIDSKYSNDLMKFFEKFQQDAENQRKYTRKLIDDNIDLRIRMANAMDEVDSELKMKAE